MYVYIYDNTIYTCSQVESFLNYASFSPRDLDLEFLLRSSNLTLVLKCFEWVLQLAL